MGELTATAVAAALVGTLGRRVLHLRGLHRIPRLLSVLLRLNVPAGVDLPVHRLPVVGTIPSAELVAPVNWSLTTLLEMDEMDERPGSKDSGIVSIPCT